MTRGEPHSRERRELGGPALVALAVLFLLGSPARAAGQDPCAGSAEPVQMQMLLEKTLFQVDVLWLTLRIGGEASEELRTLEGGGEVTDALADSVARISTHARCGTARLEFVRDVSQDRYFEAIRSSLRAAQEAGFITQETRQFVGGSLPEWYDFLDGRGVREGDRMTYRIRGDTLHLEYREAGGELLLERTDIGAERRRALLGGYFAPGSDFRDRLIRSFVRDEPITPQERAASRAIP